jgi:hypothetical protein
MMLWHADASAPRSLFSHFHFISLWLLHLGVERLLVDTFVDEIQQMLDATKWRQLHYNNDLSAMIYKGFFPDEQHRGKR